MAAGWVLHRWRRYGHDRVYAETPGGTRLGYLDLKTDTLHAREPGDLPLLAEAVAAYRRPSLEGKPDCQADPEYVDSSGGEPAVSSPQEPLDLSPQEPTEWTDLGDTSPGAAARAQARAIRDAAPIRTALARFLGVRNDERVWRIGADGEEAVAARLASLGPEWRTLHAVPVGKNGADIDHIVIGPAGVFTVNAKKHPNTSIWVGGNTFLVNGTRKDYIRNSRHEAERAERLLRAQLGHPIAVTAIIAVIGAHRGLTVKEQPRDGKVAVIARKKITDYLLRLPTVLAPHHIDAIYSFARRSTSWAPASAGEPRSNWGRYFARASPSAVSALGI